MARDSGMYARWVDQEDNAAAAAAAGRPIGVPGSKASWQQPIGTEGDLSAAYGPGAPIPPRPDNR